MAAALGPFIQEEYAMVGQRDLARQRHVPPTDQPCIRDGLVGGAKRARRDPRRAVAGEAGDAVDTNSVEDLGDGRIVRRRASLDLPAEGVLNIRFLEDRQRLDAQRGRAGKGHWCR
jgi:hypothetical protein